MALNTGMSVTGGNVRLHGVFTIQIRVWNQVNRVIGARPYPGFSEYRNLHVAAKRFRITERLNAKFERKHQPQWARESREAHALSNSAFPSTSDRQPWQL